MKKYKKIVLSFIMIFTVCLPITMQHASASENDISLVSTSGKLLVDTLERSTFYDEAGSVTLDYMSSGYVVWKVSPYTSNAYTFVGSIEIRSASGGAVLFGAPIYASGTGSKSGTVSVFYSGLKKGARYTVAMKGVLTDTAGTSMYIADNVKIDFTY